MCVTREVTGGAQFRQQSKENLRVALTRTHDPDPRVIQPFANTSNGIVD
jgi:hypothetical protein